MDLLCDEVLQLIVYELNDPSSLSLVSKRLYHLTSDPYVRAHYFLSRYGSTQAIYHALGRGKLLNPRVLDILISSGGHLSRYLCQVAIHHYFYTTSHFIKSPWVRTVSLETFTYFLKLAADRYDDIPRGKGDDDGSIFLSFIKESRFPSHLRHINWETIRDILDKYHFIPFSTKDPIMVQFPLALALEPRLLPYAVANGFYMDSKYRDFVFRKIFERPSSADRGVEDVVQNVKELCRLDKTMFVSRTVAAEVCMEAKANDIGYAALKHLDKSGELLFDLGTVVQDLLKLFLTNRTSNSQILRQLFADFPSTDPAVRVVLLMTVFTNPEGGHVSLNTVKTRLESLKLGPITRLDICNVFINPYLEKYSALVEYLRTEIQTGDDGAKGMKFAEVRAVIEDVATRCLELECKGKMLKRLYDGFPSVDQAIVRAVLTKHPISLGDLPPAEDVDACARYRPQLCRNYFLKPSEESDYFWDDGHLEDDARMAVDSDAEDDANHDSRFLGHIGQESLTTMIRQDELMPIRARRRSMWSLSSYMQTLNVSQLPYDSLPVGRWIKDEFGADSSITAVFMTHAVLNNHSSILRYYLSDHESVPITLKHFQLLAHLGRAPNFFLYSNIQAGAKFYRDEDEYIPSTDRARALLYKIKVKTEVPQPTVPPSPQRVPSPPTPPFPPSSPSSTRKKKRPRRSAATSVPSYVVPDSDDDAIAVEDDYDYDDLCEKKKKHTMDHLQLWIKHLGELLKAEQAKHRTKKKRMESEADPDVKLRVPKSEFLKSLSSNLRMLRKHDEARRMVYNTHSGDEYTGTSDDDYSRRTRAKRRKTTRG